MTNTPKVVFNSKFTLALSNPDNKYKNKDRVIKRTEKMFDYYSNEEKRAMSMFDYYTGRLNKTDTMNLVKENGEFATEEEIKKRKQLAVKYLEKSNLWQGVLSFNNDYLTNNIDVHKLEKELATNILPKFFKKCGFKDPKKMFYQLALHTDTDNLHFHFSFMEIKPNYEYNYKIGYRRSGELLQSEIDFLKAQVIHTIEKEKIYTPLLKETNKDIEELKKYFNPKEKNFILRDKKDLILEEKILNLGKLVYEVRNNNKKIKYGSIKNKEILKLTNEIKKYIFSKSNNNLKLDYANFKQSLKKINDYFSKINKDNNLNNNKVDTTLNDSKTKYIDNYIYNAIVNYANNKYKQNVRLKENDIIQEIVLNNYLNNPKKSKKDILTSYLSNSKRRFKNRYEIEKAIKNINNEMEEAKEEFSKLFQNDNYYTNNNYI